MPFHRLILASVLLAVPAAAYAQLDAPVRGAGESAIVVTGKRLTPEGKPIPMSEWRVAETEHVLFYARADEKQVARVARNLERLHFLLSVLLDRVGRPDETIKLSVTQIGDRADFNHLALGNARWQPGPFPGAFPTQLYYDPRDDGPVLATTRTDQKIVLQPGRRFDSTLLGAAADVPVELDGTGAGLALAANTDSTDALVLINEIAFASTAEGRLYSGFAQHYLLTYFPAAYPRWYLDGFGEIFATFVADKEGELEYGRAPEGYRKVAEWFGRYRIEDVLSGRYLAGRKSHTRWTPYHAWALTHLLFFSEEWRKPLHDYLAATAAGADQAEAARSLGDLGRLQREWGAYRGTKVPYEKLTYAPGRFGDPLVRQLTSDQADFLKRRLVLGARVAIPVARNAEDRRPGEALRDRSAWLADLARDAGAAPDRLDLQLLWAEAACRSGEHGQCLTAADRALRLAPANATALAWRGLALAEEAAALPEAQRAPSLAEARATIARANRADTEAPLPLLAYYRSFRGEPVPPDLAILGLVKASRSVPAAPETRLMLGEALTLRGNHGEARTTLLPVARGPHDTPEKPKALELLIRLAPASGPSGEPASN